MNKISPQPFSAKVGEVFFRNKLTKQHLGHKLLFPQEYNHQEMKQEINKRILRSRSDFNELKKRGIDFSIFLEIGAGYGQTSLLLVNEYQCRGYATDIALDPLRSFSDLKQEHYYSKYPRRIVCDAEQLPFQNNSFPLFFPSPMRMVISLFPFKINLETLFPFSCV